MNYQVLVARKERRLKQSDVAKILMIDVQSYRSRELGRIEFTIREAKRLAKFYGMTLDDLFN